MFGSEWWGRGGVCDILVEKVNLSLFRGKHFDLRAFSTTETHQAGLSCPMHPS